MKKAFILFTFLCVAVLATETKAQTRVTFARGASEKIVTVTIPARGERSFVLGANRKQAITVSDLSRHGLSVSFNLANGDDGVDNWMDYEGGLEVLTGRRGDYVFTVSNGSNRARTVRMKVRVGRAKEYQGGQE